MKNIFLLGLSIVVCVACSSDDTKEPDTTVPEFLIGATFVYQAANCDTEDPVANRCNASIAFLDKETVDILPFGDTIYRVNYGVKDKTLTVLFSDFFVDGVDMEFIIVSEIVLLDTATEDQYIRQ